MCIFFLVVQEVNIAEDTIYAISGSTIQITVTINIFDQTNFSVNWYYNGSLIDTSNNPQYSISTDTYSLTIANVKLDVLGMYEVLVTSEGNTDLTDTVSVMLLGEIVINVLFIVCLLFLTCRSTHCSSFARNPNCSRKCVCDFLLHSQWYQPHHCLVI